VKKKSVTKKKKKKGHHEKEKGEEMRSCSSFVAFEHQPSINEAVGGYFKDKTRGKKGAEEGGGGGENKG